LREEYKLRVFENKVPTNIFGHKKGKGWGGLVTKMRGKKCIRKFGGETSGKECPLLTPRRSLEDNTKTDLRGEVERIGVGWSRIRFCLIADFLIIYADYLDSATNILVGNTVT
jgi:hypothetical protein